MTQDPEGRGEDQGRHRSTSGSDADTKVQVGKGPTRVSGCAGPGQRDLEATQGSEFCRNTAGGLRSENIYRAQTGQLGGGGGTFR